MSRLLCIASIEVASTALLSGVCAVAQQAISFSRTTYANSPFTTVAADINHDGFADSLAPRMVGVPTSTFFSTIVAIVVEIADGNAASRVTRDCVRVTPVVRTVADHDVTYGDYGQSLSGGDINGDGRQDLALTVCCVDNNQHANIIRMINVASAAASAPSFNVGFVEKGTATSLTLVDIDKDGRADYLIPYYPNSSCQAVNCSTIQGVTWIYNNANGTTTKSGYHFPAAGNWETGAGAVCG